VYVNLTFIHCHHVIFCCAYATFHIFHCPEKYLHVSSAISISFFQVALMLVLLLTLKSTEI